MSHALLWCHQDTYLIRCGCFRPILNPLSRRRIARMTRSSSIPLSSYSSLLANSHVYCSPASGVSVDPQGLTHH